MKRREFIKYTSQIGLGSYLTALLRHPLQAQERESSYLKNLIYVHFDSGWDVTLGVDPQIKNLPLSDTALFLGYRADEILQIENLRLGPAAHLLKSYALNSIVINGVSMLGNVSHEECRRWTQTGILERRTGGMPAMMAQSRSDDQLAQVVSGQGGLEEGRFSVSPVNPYSLRNFVNVTASESEDFLEPDSIIAQSQKLLNRYGVQLAHVINQNSEIKEMLVNGNTFESTQAAIALCFQTGYARSAVVPLMPGQNSLDTHTNHAREHLPAQKDCFEQLLSLVSFLQKIPAQKGSHSLYDETLIVVSSDFSREIGLNGNSLENSGKEHNGYTNSYLLMSGGIRGGFTIGESTIQPNALNRPAAHVARNFDFEKSAAILRMSDAPQFMNDPEAIKQIRPGHVVRTVASLMGFEHLLDPALTSLPKLKLLR